MTEPKSKIHDTPLTERLHLVSDEAKLSMMHVASNVAHVVAHAMQQSEDVQKHITSLTESDTLTIREILVLILTMGLSEGFMTKNFEKDFPEDPPLDYRAVLDYVIEQRERMIEYANAAAEVTMRSQMDKLKATNCQCIVCETNRMAIDMQAAEHGIDLSSAPAVKH